MATRCLSRSILKKLSSSATATAAASRARTLPSFSHIRHRAISTAALFNLGNLLPTTAGLRRYSSLPATTSLRDNDPNFSNRPPKETILLDGCDFEHWLVVLEKPEGEPTREEIIDTYVKTLAQLLGSEEEARAKIYSVSTRCYFAFGCLIPEEMTYKMKELPQVRWVLPDSYLDVRNKDYGGEPFINGQAVPYDPKYHEEWIRNNARAGERNRRNDRPRNNDRSRNFERRRENMETRDVNRGPPNPAPMGGPPHNMGEPPQQMGGPGGPPTQQMGGPGGPPRQMGGPGGPPQQMGGPGGPPRQMGGPGGPPQQMGGPGGPPQQMGRPGGPPRQMGGPGGPPQQMGGPGGPPPNNAWSPPPPNNAWSPPPNHNMRGPPPPNNAWSPPPNNAWSPPPPNNAWAPPPNSMGGQQPPSMGGQQPPYMGGQQPPNMGGQQPPNNYQNNYGPPDGNVPYQR